MLRLVLWVGFLGALHTAAWGQGLRGSAQWSARYVAFQPIRQDTVDRSLITEAGGLFYRGQPVYCQGDDCLVFRSGGVDRGVALTQDLRLTAWGLGLQGVSGTVVLRSRADLGGAFSWPRSDDRFDALLAYAEWSRPRYRVRMGRLQTMDGLGFSGYDGGSLLLQPVRWLRLEGYGGRSLARGLYEARHAVLRSLEDFVLDRNAFVVGGSLALEPFSGTRLQGRYQRSAWSEDWGLIGERLSVAGRTVLPGSVQLNGELDWDLGFDRLGTAQLNARLPLWPRTLNLQLGYKRYVPYFELSTIWGFFDPTGFDEYQARLTWTPRLHLMLWGATGWRQYRETATQILPPAEEDRTRRFSLGLRWAAAAWDVEGSYLWEDGFGAYISSADLRLGRQISADLRLALHATAFQQIEAFRTGDGMVVGGGADAEWRVWKDLRLEGGLALYRQTFKARPDQVDWDQVRGWTALHLPIGRDPGTRRRRP